MASVAVSEARSPKEVLSFIKFPLGLYQADPNYCPMPIFEQKKMFFPEKNPFFKDAEVKYFLSRQDGRITGRIASIVNRRHNAAHADGAGFFGFFECDNDQATAKKLLDTAAFELKKAGMQLMRGPMNFSTNEECGFLLEGGEPGAPMIMMPYNPVYYNSLMEKCGMQKAKDLLAFIAGVHPPEKMFRVAAMAEKRGFKTRNINLKKLRDELAIFREIYNSAWKDNWGFLPITLEEVDDMAKRLKGVLVEELTAIVEAPDGEPVGFLGLVPDLNQALIELKAKLTPIRIIKAINRFRKIDALRLMLLGVKDGWRGKGIESLLMKKGVEGIRKSGDKYKKLEFSWILEDNLPVIKLSEICGGTPYRRYRIYEKEI
ncbi:MAG: hypothetical protein M0018_05725 [Nitrospiraceae bacterium]|nr:hypothetical protein [Nitrospiraceae bacterium]